jgi:hypothetical protein
MRQSHRLGWVFCLLCLLALVSCNRQPETIKPFQYHPDVKAVVYYPLEVGNSWTFDVVEYNVDGSVAGKDMLIIRVVSRNGEIVTLETGGKTIQYRITIQGILKHPSTIPLIREPVLAHAEWAISNQGVMGIGRIESVDGKFISNSGLFDHCLVVVEEYPEEGLRIKSEYAPRVGLARMEEYILVGDQSFLHLQATLRIYSVSSGRR